MGLINIRSADTEFDLVWTPSRQLSDSTVANPRAYVDKTVRYTVSTKTRTGCDISKSIDILHPEYDYKMQPEDGYLCYLEPTQIKLNYGELVEWYEGNFQTPKTLYCNECNPTIARVDKDITYIAVVTDSLGCKDTLASSFEVKPLPEVKIWSADTTILYGTDIQLMASGGYKYIWSPEGGLSDPSIQNPIARPLKPTTYEVAVTGDFGCTNFDTIHINVDNRGHLLMPNAFSPNGDGKNDVFRIPNLTFQKLESFHVFNRQGQEVFITNDANEGWDGTYKGIPQDMGTYMYMIKLTYPDGFTDYLSGDVTLIR